MKSIARPPVATWDRVGIRSAVRRASHFVDTEVAEARSPPWCSQNVRGRRRGLPEITNRGERLEKEKFAALARSQPTQKRHHVFHALLVCRNVQNEKIREPERS